MGILRSKTLSMPDLVLYGKRLLADQVGPACLSKTNGRLDKTPPDLNLLLFECLAQVLHHYGQLQAIDKSVTILVKYKI